MRLYFGAQLFFGAPAIQPAAKETCRALGPPHDLLEVLCENPVHRHAAIISLLDIGCQ